MEQSSLLDSHLDRLIGELLEALKLREVGTSLGEVIFSNVVCLTLHFVSVAELPVGENLFG